jgi:hypothetical protein
MAKSKNIWLRYIIILAVALILLLFVSVRNQRYKPKVSSVFDISSEDINAVTITKDTTSLTIIKSDTAWVFAEPDTGLIKDFRVDNFFKYIVNGKKSGFITKNPDKYDQYNVSEKLGLKLDLKKGEYVLGTIYIGRSKINWSQDYIRYPDDPKVYISQNKMLSHVSERASFWRR